MKQACVGARARRLLLGSTLGSVFRMLMRREKEFGNKK